MIATVLIIVLKLLEPLYKPLLKPVDPLWKQLKPPRALSWQTLIMLSLLSWVMSLLAQTGFVKEGFARVGSIFFTVGVAWALWRSQVDLFGLKVRVGPWVAGAIGCAFVFQGWFGNTEAAFVWWPVVSMMMSAVPRFLPGLVFTIPPPPVRQEIIIQLLLGFTLSSWIKFHFLVQEWLLNYPSLLADDFSRSAFVVRLDEQRANEPRGALLLNQAEAILRQQLQSLSWSEVERWLLEAEQRVPALRTEILRRIPPLPEDSWWVLQGQVPPGEPEYTLKLRAFWVGPRSRPNAYYVEKSCRITQTPGQPAETAPGTAPGAIAPLQPGTIAPLLPASQIECRPVSDKMWY